MKTKSNEFYFSYVRLKIHLHRKPICRGLNSHLYRDLQPLAEDFTATADGYEPTL
jgi:hypothetical protein